MFLRLIAGAAVGFIVAYAVYEFSDGIVTTADFIAGPAVMQPSAKARDLLALLTMGAVSAAVMAGLTVLSARLSRQARVAPDEFHSILLWCLIPLIVWLGFQMSLPWLARRFPPHALSLSLLSQTAGLIGAVILAGVAYLIKARSRRDTMGFATYGTISLSIGFFAGLVPLGLVTLIGRVAPDLAVPAIPPVLPWVMLACGGAAFLAAQGLPDGHLPRLLILLQWAALPLLAAILPQAWDPALVPSDNAAPVKWEPVLLAGLIAIIIAIDLRRRAGGGQPLDSISPLAFVPVIIAFSLSLNIAPTLPADDYHFGEQIIPYRAIWLNHAVPYRDIIPAHGLIDTLAPLTAHLIYGDAIVNVVLGEQLLTALLLSVLFLCLARLSNIGFGLMVVILVSLITLPYLLMLSVFLALIGWWDRLKPVNWCLTALALAFVLFLLDPFRGTVLMMALVVPLILLLRRVCHDRTAVPSRGWLILGLLLLAGFILTPLGSMSGGALRYLWEQASINDQAYAFSWVPSWEQDRGRTTPIYEFLRFSWTLAVGFLAVLTWTLRAGHFPPPSLAVANLPQGWVHRAQIMAIMGCVFLLGLSPYTTGRISLAGTDRSALASFLAWGLIVPICIMPLVTKLARAYLAVVCALIIGLFGSRIDPLRLVDAADPYKGSPADASATLIDALPDIGVGYMNGAHRDRLAALRSVLDSLLLPGETYLDLTNRAALYAYMGRPVPVAIAASYNLAHPNDQLRAIVRLQKDGPPPVTLLWADNIVFGASNPSLRTPLLYRWIVEHYQPLAQGQFILAVHSGHPILASGATEYVMAANRDDAAWRQGVARDAAKIVVTEPRTLAGLQPGDALVFAQSGPRTILAIDGAEIQVAGGLLNPELDGAGHKIGLRLQTTSEAQRRIALWSAVFANETLEQLSWVWGQSAEQLTPSLMPIQDLKPEMISADGISYRIDPILKGRDAGYLYFRLNCPAPGSHPVILSLRWTGLTKPIHMTGRSGVFIVPLEAHPRWLLNDAIDNLSIQIDSSSPCDGMGINEASLRRRIVQP